MRQTRNTLTGLVFTALALLGAIAFAQTDTSTVTSTGAPTLFDLVTDAQGVYDAFTMVGVLAGITAVVNLLVNITKFGPVNAFIKAKKLKWVRPVLALVAGFLAGLVTALSQGQDTLPALLFAMGGLIAGGGAVALHELVSVIRGERAE